ncbi:MAG: hypothetical protein JWR21_904 [Herminiimonas sp.]|nr:hypothetical protein [Herminiimonas sp.]
MMAMLAAGLAASNSTSSPMAEIRLRRGEVTNTYSRGGIFSMGSASDGTKGAGINMATQKRTAKKARNVKRHRAACRS